MNRMANFFDSAMLRNLLETTPAHGVIEGTY